MDDNCARDYFIDLEQGHYPQAKDEIIADSRVLALLGVEPEMGAKIELSYYLGENTSRPELRTDTFTLCGWWEYDPPGWQALSMFPAPMPMKSSRITSRTASSI